METNWHPFDDSETVKGYPKMIIQGLIPFIARLANKDWDGQGKTETTTIETLSILSGESDGFTLCKLLYIRNSRW